MSENLNRRDFLGKSVAAVAVAGIASAGKIDLSSVSQLPDSSQDTSPVPVRKTLLAIGAHYDDCPFGIPGILLDAVSKNYRVVILNIIGDYSNWAPVKGREEELRANNIRLGAERKIEVRFLNYASMRFEANDQIKREIAEVVAEIKPDMAFMLWRRDRHPDHEVASLISEAALRQPNAILSRPDARAVNRIYYYDNGPGHTVDFEPDTYMDVSTHWTEAMKWLGETMAFVLKKTYDPGSPDPAQQIKEKLANYRGLACGVIYAEALKAYSAYPSDILK
jgi:LmbE family N-acetylglucosaminyl deacetylase